MSLRSASILAALWTAIPFALAAQQATAPTGAPTAVAAPAPDPTPAAVTPGPSVTGPQYSPLFQKSDSVPALGTPDRAVMASGGSNHTIVISTLVLVLAIVILVLLVF